MRFAAAVLFSVAAVAQDAEIFRPLDQSSVSAGRLSVVARGSTSAELRLDGKVVTVERPGPNAIAATLTLSAGKHELLLKDGGVEKKVTFSAGAAPGFTPFRPHPPAATCQTCHAVKDGAWAFKGDTLAENCFTCHKAESFAVAHSHNSDTLYECQLCHTPHGSSAVKHLKLKKEVACKLCHG